MLEFREEVVEGIVGGVEALDVVGGLELLHVFGVGKDQVEGAGRRLGDQPEHVVAAGVVLGADLDAVLALEVGDDVRLRVAGPGEDHQLFFRRVGAAHRQQAGQRGTTGQNPGADEEIAS
ncbi:hypothetical protein D9M71_531500 [compost metagenome]